MNSTQKKPGRRTFLKAAGLTALAATHKTGVAQDKSVPGDTPAMYRVEEEAPDNLQTLVALPPPGVLAWNRMAFGPRPGDIAAFNALGGSEMERLSAFVDQQLAPDLIDDSDLESRLADTAYRTLNKSLTQLWTEHYRADVSWSERIRPSRETLFATLTRAVYSKRQLVEVLADFWHNHFNVYGYETPTASLMVHYDRDVIRPHLLGNFRDMLEANAKSPVMLYYLDNYTSSDDGPNENYARELLELHTMGAENYLGIIPQWEVPLDSEGRPVAYVDGDVLEVARCFTGWTVSNGHWSDPTDMDTGEFFYRDFWHDRFQKYVLGEFIPADQDAMEDGLRVLDMLAEHPATARYICRKLCRRFISDNPPETLVQSAAEIFHANWESPDQIALTVRHILLSPQFATTWGEKIKRPTETIVSAMRACEAEFTLDADDSDSNSIRWQMEQTGHLLFNWVPPNGYPDERPIWQGSSPLVMSWRIINWLLRRTDDYGTFKLDVVTTTIDLVPVDQRTPRIIAQFWFQRILGYLPDNSQVDKAAAFLQRPDAYDVGDPSWDLDTPVDLATDDWPHYWQSGLRTLVAMLLMTPEFLQR